MTTEIEHITFSDFNGCGNCGSDNRDSLYTPEGSRVNNFWYQETKIYASHCLNCNFIHGRLGDKISYNAKEIISTQEYIDQLNNVEYPFEVNQFLCYSMILDAEGDDLEATKAAVHAVLCCIWSKSNKLKECCTIAIERMYYLFHEENSNKELFDYLVFKCLCADLYRLSGSTQKGIDVLADCYLSKGTTSIFQRRLLAYVYHLFDKLEAAEFTKSDVLSMQKKIFRKEWKELKYYSEEIYEEDFEEDYFEPKHNNEEENYFDTMTDGELGDFDSFKKQGGTLDDVDDWAGR